MAAADPVVAVVMAGGSGTRFWPLSTPARPKQFLPLFGDRSMLAATADRLGPLVAEKDRYVCATRDLDKLAAEVFPDARRRIVEPAGRNTAPCLMLSCARLLAEGRAKETVMIALPADHHIGDAGAFRSALADAIGLARETKGLVTLGIVPESPHTGYGYIEAGQSLPGGAKEARRVARFVEKPDRARAEQFLRAGNFFWNGGIFVWRLDALEAAFARFLPEAWSAIRGAAGDDRRLGDAYRSVPAAPIDTAVLEKAENLYVIPVSMGWSDVGSWDALYRLRAKGGGAVVLSGDVKSRESSGCLVSAPAGKHVALVGVEGLVVVDTGDTLLVLGRESDQLVREASKDFDRKG